MVSCPHCDSANVTQLPSAPYVRRQGQESAAGQTRPAIEERMPSDQSETAVEVSATVQKLFMMLATMAKQAENVGERFPEEARRIHYDEVPARNIRGTASAEDALELIEEGILILPAPVPSENETH